jgi:hypothetical protein
MNPVDAHEIVIRTFSILKASGWSEICLECNR